MINKIEINKIIEKQRSFFLKGNTLNIEYRIDILKKLKKLVLSNYNKIVDAFEKEFNKCEFDVVSTEIGIVISEIDYFIKNLKKLIKPTKVKTNLINVPSKSYIFSVPYGVTLIMSPWNYPFQLALVPLIGSIACGNTVVLKPSNYAPKVSDVICEIMSNFDERLIAVCIGGREINQDLLDQKFDYIFFTGSVAVGKYVMEKASKFLTPVTLELGGKSPCIVDESCDIDLTAKRIVWGKFLNAGQTCVAPDYILVHKNIHNDLVKKIINYIELFYYNNNRLTKDFPQIINNKHIERLNGLLEYQQIVFGGNVKGLTFEPTVLDNVSFCDKVMKEEIFGPILPIIEYDFIDNYLYDMKRFNKPLALYIFSNRKDFINKVLNSLNSGGVCINDVVMHLTNDNLPFGGVGTSGMGNYHGKHSFDTFSHKKAVFVKGKREFDIKYPPYTEKKLSLIKKIMRIYDK